jgi:putative FmdB family regulatory protein
MPTYDYECTKCGHKFEAFQSITADHLTDCPECKKKKALRRLIGAGAGLIFKGTGFYATDYKSPTRKQDESVDRHKRAAKEVKESTKAQKEAAAAATPAPTTPPPAASSGTSSGTSST